MNPKTKSGILIAIGALAVSTIGCCGIFGLAGLYIEPQKVAQTTPQPSIENTQKKPTEKPTETPKKGGVTLENFNKLKTGMTYSQVVAILGKEGELISENEIGDYKTVMYQWSGDEGWGANMNAMFQNGKLIQKSQFGLK